MAETYQKILTFSLGDEGYGVSINKIKEVIGVTDIIPIPRTPAFIKGIINLRGKIIPVMDLRIKFGMKLRAYDEETCIMITNVTIDGDQKTFGVIVDNVDEVITISTEEIEAPPEYGENEGHNSILGIGKIKDKIVILLELDEIFISDGIVKISEKEKEHQKIKQKQAV